MRPPRMVAMGRKNSTGTRYEMEGEDVPSATGSCSLTSTLLPRTLTTRAVAPDATYAPEVSTAMRYQSMRAIADEGRRARRAEWRQPAPDAAYQRLVLIGARIAGCARTLWRQYQPIETLGVW